jgi:hypothetical protein
MALFNHSFLTFSSFYSTSPSKDQPVSRSISAKGTILLLVSYFIYSTVQLLMEFRLQMKTQTTYRLSQATECAFKAGMNAWIQG